MLDFDGSSDYTLRSVGLGKIADSKVGTFACWFRRDSTPGSTENLFSISEGSSERFAVRRGVDDTIKVLGVNSSGVTIMFFSSSVFSATTDSSFSHLVVSWDLANSTFTMYIDDVDVLGTITTQTDDNIDYTGTTVAVGARSHDGGNKWDGGIGEIFFDAATYADLSDIDQRRFFISQDGVDVSVTQGTTVTPKSHADGGTGRHQVGYGATGGDPLGRTPEVYLTGALTINKGLGGDFVIQGSPTYIQDALPYRRAALHPTPGERWFDSDRSGFSYPRSRTIIQNGQRVGIDEHDDIDRDDTRDQAFLRFLNGQEDDSSETREPSSDVKFWRR